MAIDAAPCTEGARTGLHNGGIVERNRGHVDRVPVDRCLADVKKGGRNDLIAQNEAEIKIIESYLPAALSPDEVRDAIKAEIAKGAAQIGPLMKALRERFGAQLDGKMASELVKQELAARG